MAYYVPKKTSPPDKLPLHQLTHIIFSFTEVIDNKMQFPNPKQPDLLKLLVKQKKKYPHLKVMIACGGWGGSGGFSDMAATATNRAKFVKSVYDFIQKYQLDGLDMDWEYPGLRGAGNTHRPEDKQNFTQLMKELREALDKTGRKQTLTFASAGWERYYDHVETLEVLKYADYMNVMTYDLAGGGSRITAHHTALGTPFVASEQSEEARKIYKGKPAPSAQRIIDYCLAMNVNPKQLVIGAAFYGRAWKGVKSKNNGLYQPNTGVYAGWLAYSKIRPDYENKNGYVRYWDKEAQAPYLYNKEKEVFITYDDTASVRLKTQFVKQQKLGGIMFWELALDCEKENLLDAIYNESKKK
ncbi:glycoside hydrolase family 18 protein [Prolixibacteraceae bacterium JC049]|nr:glycoside hydrolase family 18 protein [Prolixibacteraceae bacterium JC049]